MNSMRFTRAAERAAERPSPAYTAITALQVLKANDTKPGEAFAWDKDAVAKRAYKNKALALLCASQEQQWRDEALARFRAADNMTDTTAAMAALLDQDCPERAAMLEEFYVRWKEDSLVVLKWLTLQARSAVLLYEGPEMQQNPAQRLLARHACEGSLWLTQHGQAWLPGWQVRERA